MSEELQISSSVSREQKYIGLIPQLKYLVRDEGLILGPFQGEIACSRIGFGKGICGASWGGNQTLVFPNVDEFPGHIACSSASKAEIVRPIKVGGKVVDSYKLGGFSAVDGEGLETVSQIINPLFK